MPSVTAFPRPAPYATETLLSARGLTWRAGGATIVDGVDLAIEAGRLTVLLGPNGAGKSVLLRLLHGLITPSEGAVLRQGAPLDRAARERQAMVFQRPVLLRRSVAANIRHALAARRVARPEREARVAEALAQAGLAAFAARPARVLSGGEQQRLAIARALAMRPEILFLDEPSASLDPAATMAVEELVREAHAGGMTVVLVTHDLGQARRLAEEIVFMNRGRVETHAEAARFFSRPGSSAAAAFIEGRLIV